MAATSKALEPFANMKFRLNTSNVNQMPAIGLGTYRMKTQDEVTLAIDNALDAGYRLFDTAAVYRNEHFIQRALKTLLPKYNLEREDIFITTKLSPSDHGNVDTVERACKKSLERLGVDYIDLYLIHFPGTSGVKADNVQNKTLRIQTWCALEKLYDQGLVNAIGVSNFTISHLEHLMLNNHSVMPAVNQVEFHPYYNQNELLSFCNQKEIVVQAYSSFGGTSSSNLDLMDDPVIKRIAAKNEATCAQVLLVWALQKGIAVIPKSTNPVRIKENISLNFRLTEKETKEVDELRIKNMKYAWDPTAVV